MIHGLGFATSLEENLGLQSHTMVMVEANGLEAKDGSLAKLWGVEAQNQPKSSISVFFAIGWRRMPASTVENKSFEMLQTSPDQLGSWIQKK